MFVPLVPCVYVIEDCVCKWKSGSSSLKVSQPVPMLRFLYELAWTMVRGIVSQMAQDLTLSGEFRSRLIKLARWFVESELVPVRLLQERCEEEFLGEAEFIKIKAQELKGKEDLNFNIIRRMLSFLCCSLAPSYGCIQR
ncbi:unnamed protein product [Lathyrus sativus]|nr:unnamed protein product [Lathyrus sativus]